MNWTNSGASWWRVCYQLGLPHLVSSYPALLLLPVFTCFTLGSYKEGEDGLVLSWKWTTINMLASYSGATMRMLLQLEVFETTYNHSWLSQIPNQHTKGVWSSTMFLVPTA